ncbi:hypothetical protein QJS10_CPA01g01372 [Acorus calamus]|uniref:Uncharacterized protein n=1 Tax=Acorus calamus TaxID=4465 RepID=A0AAV9FG89_ACOCL|nr:hypothetical protein QJS10_CPA01g01372 [Acorus calamus]
MATKAIHMIPTILFLSILAVKTVGQPYVCPYPCLPTPPLPPSTPSLPTGIPGNYYAPPPPPQGFINTPPFVNVPAPPPPDPILPYFPFYYKNPKLPRSAGSRVGVD